MHVARHGVVAALDEKTARDAAKRKPGARGSGMPPARSSRKLRLVPTAAMASSVASGAMITSVNTSMIFLAASASNVRFSATMPPKALVDRRERPLVGREKVVPSATPHGLACLMIATAALPLGSNSATHS